MYIDITFPISKKLPKWPNSVGYEYNWLLSMPSSSNNLSSFSIDTHYGTHIDAPLHFINDGMPVNDIPLSKFFGKVYVLEAFGHKVITDSILENYNIPEECTKLILKTDNQVYWLNNLTEFQEDFCSIDSSGASWIIDRKIDFIGIDYLSIQRYSDGPQTHQKLLENNVLIAECLNLEFVKQGFFELYCFPLNLFGLEGAPARIILKNISN